VQDPKFTAKSTLVKPIGIPLCAITTSRGFRADSGKKTPPKKKRKHTRSADELALTAASDSDEMEDIQFLLSDNEGDDGPDGKSLDHILILYVKCAMG
jgi:ubiquitin-conjugating enzyme E2 Q